MQQTELKSYGQWMLNRQLGSGGFGEVLLWRNRATGQEVATKRLKENSNLSADEIEKLKQRWLQEYEWTRDLDSPYIVRGVVLSSGDDQSFVSYLNDSHAWRPLPVIIMEYCNGGDLRTQLQQPENVNGLPELVVRGVLAALRNAINFLHQHCRIFHRDLKPDNVVICQEPNGRKTYKLTDFGFARRDPEHTAKQSVVGTQHYFAPEILDTANYKINVDYWSLGVIAYELCCGVMPFIPHQSMYAILMNIRRKSFECISITEDFHKPELFHFVNQLPAEQRLSDVFSEQITKWLRVALDVDAKRRGLRKGPTDEVQAANTSPIIFTELDAILQTKVLSVYCVNAYKFLAYEVNEGMSLNDLKHMIGRDTGIELENQYWFLPTGHPQKCINERSRPIDLCAPDWTDPVMLYVVGYQCDYNASERPPISQTVRHCLHLDWPAVKAKAPWLLRQFGLHVHFVLASEQEHLATHMDGLKEYAMQVEDSMMQYTEMVQQLLNAALVTKCQINQFKLMLECGKQAIEQKFANGSEFYANWIAKSCQFDEDYKPVHDNIIKINTRYQSALRNLKEEAKNPICDELKQNDIFGLTTFRSVLRFITHQHPDAERLFELCKKAVYDCVNKRDHFHKNIHVRKMRESVSTMHKLFAKVLESVRMANAELQIVCNRLSEAYTDYHVQLLGASQPTANTSMAQLTKSVHALSVDGANGILQRSLNGNPQSNSFDDILGISTHELISQALQNMELMNVDGDDDIPATVHQENGMS